MGGDWLLMGVKDLQKFVAHELPSDSSLFADVQARHLAAHKRGHGFEKPAAQIQL